MTRIGSWLKHWLPIVLIVVVTVIVLLAAHAVRAIAVWSWRCAVRVVMGKPKRRARAKKG